MISSAKNKREDEVAGKPVMQLSRRRKLQAAERACSEITALLGMFTEKQISKRQYERMCLNIPQFDLKSSKICLY